MKPVYIITLTIAIALFLSLPLYAFDIELQPKTVVPGDVFYVEIQGKENALAQMEFQGETFDVYPASRNRLVALIPVDINTKPGNYTMTITRGDEKQSADIGVKKHEFETIKLTLPKGKVTLSSKNQKRANREAAVLNKLWQQNSFKVWDGSFISPTNTEISTLFGVKRIMNEVRTSVHRGVDFRGKTGTPVKSINAGIAVLNDDLFFGGNTLIIDHGMGLLSVYMHLSEFKVSKGEQVSKGQVVGLVGMSGRATGPHLHLSVKLKGVSINPDALFRLEL